MMIISGDVQITLAAFIWKTRKELGYTQKSLAKFAGVSLYRVRYLEQHNDSKLLPLYKIAKALGFKLSIGIKEKVE